MASHKKKHTIFCMGLCDHQGLAVLALDRGEVENMRLITTGILELRMLGAVEEAVALIGDSPSTLIASIVVVGSSRQ